MSVRPSSQITAVALLTLVLIILAELGIRQNLRLLCFNCPSLELKEGMDVFEAIRGRRSVRAFKGQDVPVETVEKLVEAAQWAPSAGNLQPWEFIIVRRSETKRRLAEAALDQTFIQEAPVVIVVCADENRSSRGYGTRGRTLYCLQDTAAAIQNLHLAAYSLGLGTCWVGAFEEEKAREVLRIPEGVRPVAMIPVGYPDEAPASRRRRPTTQIIRYETC